jgi:hypothetical protein
MTKRNLIRSSALAVFLAVWSAVAPPLATADQSVYITGSGNEFGTLDLTTGAFNSIATLNLPAGDAIYGMGFANGILYGVDSQPNANLWQINTNTGGLTDLGAIGQSAIGATSDASGQLFVLSQDVNAIYYTMNPPSTSPNVVATTTINTAGGLVAVSADGSQLFATALNSTQSAYDLLSINPTTGAVSTVGNLGGTFTPDAGLFVGGTLYGFDTTSDAIVTINTSTGLGTQVATYSLPNGDVVFAAAYVVPEPSGLVLSLIATVVAGSFGVIRHRRRT